jgi:hypothetical protein
MFSRSSWRCDASEQEGNQVHRVAQ